MNLKTNGKFNHDVFGSLSVFRDDNNNCWFIASDVAKSLGYSNPHDAISRHCKRVVKHESLTKGGIQQINIIPEPDLYRLIFNSKLESAASFQNWVFEEVLTSIRKTGMYATQDIINRMIDDKQWGTGLLLEVKKHLDNTPRQVQKQATRLAKSEFASFGNFMGIK